MLNDVSCIGATGDELKQVSEETNQNVIRIKHGHLKLSEQIYSPCIATHNIPTLEDFKRKIEPLSQAEKGRFTEEDYINLFTKRGRFRMVFWRRMIPTIMRHAPSGKKGAYHKKCAHCAALMWLWFCAYMEHPRAYTKSTMHDDSDTNTDMSDADSDQNDDGASKETCTPCPADEDDRRAPIPTMEEMASDPTRIHDLYTRGSKYKLWKYRRDTEARKKFLSKDTTETVPLTKEELEMVAEYRRTRVEDDGDAENDDV